KGGAKRIEGYINSDSIKKNRGWINKYKLFISKAYSADAITPPELIIADPRVVCTETFLVIGPFDNKNEQLNCLKYTETNFFKILLFFGRGTMQVSQKVFRFIPLQDFTSSSDIDWSKPIADIDRQLYAKYGLTDEEIAFIESMIKPME
ncbi:MAG TPA: DEAD/DEAH box helicase, partial [Dysgonamonadaceae bacterium]|nr:DEAD/DEAH box helicase [Dysgonamonadaceae bacterium]